MLNLVLTLWPEPVSIPSQHYFTPIIQHLDVSPFYSIEWITNRIYRLFSIRLITFLHSHHVPSIHATSTSHNYPYRIFCKKKHFVDYWMTAKSIKKYLWNQNWQNNLLYFVIILMSSNRNQGVSLNLKSSIEPNTIWVNDMDPDISAASLTTTFINSNLYKSIYNCNNFVV